MLGVRRAFILLLGLCGCLEAASLRGRLIVEEGKPSAVDAGGKRIAVSGDEPTAKVLGDERLGGAEVEFLGRFEGPGKFAVDPMHKKALWVHRDGRRLRISYWCDVCYIRTYSPGRCWCCQKDTDLDPIDADHEH